jgi:Flp pilus assembly protein TadG
MNHRGTSVLEFALLLPLLLLLLIGMVDVCVLLDSELRLTHLSREAANVCSRGAGFDETFAALTRVSGTLQLDGPTGKAILTKISLDKHNNPVITDQQSIGGLNRRSAVGTLPPGAGSAPAVVPNGRTIPRNMSLVVVELFSQQQHFYGRSGLASGKGTIVLGSLAVF